MNASGLRGFSPAWFAVVMGTGGFASLAFQWSRILAAPGVRVLALALGALAAAQFVVLLVPWLARWLWHYPAARADLDHPLLGNFYVTLPVAWMVLVLDADQMAADVLGPAWTYGLTWSAWLIGAVGVLALSIYVSYNLIRGDGPPPNAINLAWLLAPVAAVVIPLVGDPLTQMLLQRRSPWAWTMGMADVAFLGMGLLLFLLIGAFVLGRLFQHRLPSADAAPTFWIALGPIGVGSIALLDQAALAAPFHLASASAALVVLAVALWGLGLWALGLAIVITAHYLRRGGIPFSLGVWAFTFPLSVYALSTLRLHGVLSAAPAIEPYAAVLTGILAVLWLWAAVATVAALVALPAGADAAGAPPSD
jgi:C4-dicarboxylate transporter/malic acid transport protein